jgi:hypothetical protein
MAFKSILDPDFKYRDSKSTDVRKTFARIRREQRLAQRRQENQQDCSGKVVATDFSSRKRAAR